MAIINGVTPDINIQLKQMRLNIAQSQILQQPVSSVSEHQPEININSLLVSSNSSNTKIISEHPIIVTVQKQNALKGTSYTQVKYSR